MDKFLTELDEANKYFQFQIMTGGGGNWPGEASKHFELIKKTAQIFSDLYPLLVQLCEARKGATEGEWKWNGEGLYCRENLTYVITASYEYDEGTSVEIEEANADFIALSANLTTQIQKILEGK